MSNNEEGGVSETPTPETDNYSARAEDYSPNQKVVPSEVARSLEQSRDQWKARAEELASVLHCNCKFGNTCPTCKALARFREMKEKQ